MSLAPRLTFEVLSRRPQRLITSLERAHRHWRCAARTRHSSAFDTDWWARKVARLLAIENNVTNVELKSLCTAQWLKHKTAKGRLILAD